MQLAPFLYSPGWQRRGVTVGLGEGEGVGEVCALMCAKNKEYNILTFMLTSGYERRSKKLPQVIIWC
jgi:hypothetical protein